MGFGGITALGCTIGQAITGFSTLALGSIITFAAIVAGSAATMKWQYWRLIPPGLIKSPPFPRFTAPNTASKSIAQRNRFETTGR